MSTYIGKTRTNYFSVKDEKQFQVLMNRAYCANGEVVVFEEKDREGKKRFAFCCDGEISGVRHAKEDTDENADDTAYGEFISELQKCIADDDAVIILHAGFEKFRYISGLAEIVTSNGCDYLDITELAKKKAAEMLGNKNWCTECEY